MNHLLDIYATKGIEYLVVIGFLALMVPAWLVLRPPRTLRRAAAALLRMGSGWFPVAEDRWYHPGHTWARVEEDGEVRVGIDALAARLLGIPEDIDLPSATSSLDQGGRGLVLRAGGRTFRLASPVDGQVVEVNPRAVADPALVADDPYGEGWLLRVRLPGATRSLRNLMDARTAASGMALAEDAVRARLAPAMGEVLQDGGEPVPGALREVDPEAWEALARELLRCCDDAEA